MRGMCRGRPPVSHRRGRQESEVPNVRHPGLLVRHGNSWPLVIGTAPSGVLRPRHVSLARHARRPTLRPTRCSPVHVDDLGCWPRQHRPSGHGQGFWEEREGKGKRETSGSLFVLAHFVTVVTQEAPLGASYLDE